MASFLDSLMSRSKREQPPVAPPSAPASPIDDDASPVPTSSYGKPHSSCVHVTTKCGATLEADAVIITAPLAILAIPEGAPGHISFSPPLPRHKQLALQRLGVGAYNKCCMSFRTPFWRGIGASRSPASDDGAPRGFDFIGHASAEHGKDILFFTMRNAAILVAIYGGSEYATSVESMHDEAVVAECMTGERSSAPVTSLFPTPWMAPTPFFAPSIEENMQQGKYGRRRCDEDAAPGRSYRPRLAY